jgi:hypothetical protein
MKAPTLLLLLVLVAVVLFAALNWHAIVAPTTVSLLVTDIQAPLGLLLLGITVLISALFLIFVVYLQTTVLLEARRHSRELQTQRELADSAEASRFTELRGHLDTGLRKLSDDVRASIEQSGNSLAAYIGELEDRLEHRDRN